MNHDHSQICSNSPVQNVAPLRIIKLGGSLLELNDLRARFERWLASQPVAINLVVTGGGQAVDAIRTLDEIHRFDSGFVHWLCVDLMSITSQLTCELLGRQGLLDTPEALQRFLSEHRQCIDTQTSTAIVDPRAYYTPELSGASTCTLPESWDCTSDSIAAWLAGRLCADQLVLLKSASPKYRALGEIGSQDLETLARDGYVDTFFPSVAGKLRSVQLVNLRPLD